MAPPAIFAHPGERVSSGRQTQIDQLSGLTATPASGTPDDCDDGSETFEDLIPCTYTCTVIIDP